MARSVEKALEQYDKLLAAYPQKAELWTSDIRAILEHALEEPTYCGQMWEAITWAYKFGFAVAWRNKK